MRSLAALLLVLGLADAGRAVGTVDSEPDLVPLIPKAAPPATPAPEAPAEKKPAAYPRLVPWKQLFPDRRVMLAGNEGAQAAPPPVLLGAPPPAPDAPQAQAPHGKSGTALWRLG